MARFVDRLSGGAVEGYSPVAINLAINLKPGTDVYWRKRNGMSAPIMIGGYHCVFPGAVTCDLAGAVATTVL